MASRRAARSSPSIRRETPPAARVVGHQHHVAAGQRDEGGQRGALGAALLLVDLHDDFLALADQLAHGGLVRVDALDEVLPGDLLQRQEAVAVAAVVDERGLEAGFDPGDPALVDVGLLLFPGRQFKVEVVEELSVDDRHAQLFALRGIDQHAFH